MIFKNNVLLVCCAESVTVRETARCLSSHPATAQGLCAMCTRPVCSSGSSPRTSGAVSCASSSSSCRARSSRSVRLELLHHFLILLGKCATIAPPRQLQISLLFSWDSLSANSTAITFPGFAFTTLLEKYPTLFYLRKPGGFQ